MRIKYYFDTCIWRDYNEARFGFGGRPLGSYAVNLLAKVLHGESAVFYSDITIRELRSYYSDKEIEDLLGVVFALGKLHFVKVTPDEKRESLRIAKERAVPLGDVLHALIAKRLGCVLVSQDNDFKKLGDIVPYKRPEELL